MAPEQCRGSRDLDHRLDVYALGVILYELCTGRLPFEGNSVADIMIKQATEAPIDPRARAPELPEWLSRVILTAMAKDRDARFADMAAFAEALEEHLPDRESGAPARHSAPAQRRDFRSAPAPSARGATREPRTPGHLATLEPAVARAAAGTTPATRKSSVRAVAVIALLVSVGAFVASRFAATSPDAAASAGPPSPVGSEEPSAAAATAVHSAAAVVTPEPEIVTAPASEPAPAVPTPVVRPVTPDVAKPEALKPAPAPISRPAEPRAATTATAAAITVTPAAPPSAAPSPRPSQPRPRANLETFFPP
jgi:serine/threonine-protein kinase